MWWVEDGAWPEQCCKKCLGSSGWLMIDMLVELLCLPDASTVFLSFYKYSALSSTSTFMCLSSSLTPGAYYETWAWFIVGIWDTLGCVPGLLLALYYRITTDELRRPYGIVSCPMHAPSLLYKAPALKRGFLHPPPLASASLTAGTQWVMIRWTDNFLLMNWITMTCHTSTATVREFH